MSSSIMSSSHLLPNCFYALWIFVFALYKYIIAVWCTYIDTYNTITPSEHNDGFLYEVWRLEFISGSGKSTESY